MDSSDISCSIQPESRDQSLVYRVPVKRIPQDAYPLKVSLELRYALSEEGLRAEFFFTNEEPELDAHVSFGLHPGFAVSSVRDCRVLFPEGTYVRHFAPGNFLDGREEVIPFVGGEMPFDKAKLGDSYLVGLRAISARHLSWKTPSFGVEFCSIFQKCPFSRFGARARTTSASSRAGDCPTAIRPGALKRRLAFKQSPPVRLCVVLSRLVLPSYEGSDILFSPARLARDLHFCLCCSL